MSDSRYSSRCFYNIHPLKSPLEIGDRSSLFFSPLFSHSRTKPTTKNNLTIFDRIYLCFLEFFLVLVSSVRSLKREERGEGGLRIKPAKIWRRCRERNNCGFSQRRFSHSVERWREATVVVHDSTRRCAPAQQLRRCPAAHRVRRLKHRQSCRGSFQGCSLHAKLSTILSILFSLSFFLSFSYGGGTFSYSVARSYVLPSRDTLPPFPSLLNRRSSRSAIANDTWTSNRKAVEAASMIDR